MYISTKRLATIDFIVFVVIDFIVLMMHVLLFYFNNPLKIITGLLISLFIPGQLFILLVATFREKFVVVNKMSFIYLSVLTSMAILLLVGAILATLGFSGYTLFLVILIISSVSGVLILTREHRITVCLELRHRIPSIIACSIIITSTIIIWIYLRTSLPWPSLVGWDYLNELVLIGYLEQYHIMPLTAAAGFQPTGFHILLSSISALTGTRPFDLFWYGSLVLFPSYGLIVYFLSKEVFNGQTTPSLFAALFAISISGRGHFHGIDYFLTKSVFVTLVILLLILLFLQRDRIFMRPKSIKAVSVFFVIFVCSLFIHPFFVVPFIPLIAVFAIKAIRSYVVYTLGVLVVLISAFLVNVRSAELGVTPLSIGSSYRLLTISYPEAVLYLFFLGILLVALAYIKELSTHKKLPILKSPYIYLFWFSITMLIIYFMPLANVGRIELPARTFIALVAASPIAFVKNIKARSHRFSTNKLLMPLLTMFILLSIFYPSASYSLFNNHYEYGKILPYDSRIDEEDYEVAMWLRENTELGDYVITDPPTGVIMRGLAFRNASLLSLPTPQSPLSSNLGLQSQSKKPLSEQIHLFLVTTSVDEALNITETLPGDKKFIVINGRTSWWILHNETFTGYINFVNFPGMAKFQPPYFDKVFQKGSTRIFLVNTQME